MDIQTNLRNVLAELPEGVRLVAVSKFHPAEAIEEAYRAGQRIFGESKEQMALYRTSANQQSQIHRPLHHPYRSGRFL